MEVQMEPYRFLNIRKMTDDVNSYLRNKTCGHRRERIKGLPIHRGCSVDIIGVQYRGNKHEEGC